MCASPLQIEVGFGGAIVPAPEELEFPTLLKFPAPMLSAYPKESVVAEKFQAIVKLGMANSRMGPPPASTDLTRGFSGFSARAGGEKRRTSPLTVPRLLGETNV